MPAWYPEDVWEDLTYSYRAITTNSTSASTPCWGSNNGWTVSTNSPLFTWGVSDSSSKIWDTDLSWEDTSVKIYNNSSVWASNYAYATNWETYTPWHLEDTEETRKAVAKAEKAKDRSYQLLYQHLTDEQKTMLENENKFLVVSHKGNIYEIRRGRHMNVFRLGLEGKPVEKLCCLPGGGVPEGDVMLAQMLHLMTNEDRFRKKANKWEIN